MLKLMLICNDPELARFAASCGVDRIFVDLEVLGKQERQGHLDTVMSRHSIEDVARVRKAVPEAELLVRLNPMHPGTAEEVERALDAGADLLMLPMFRQAAEVERFIGYIAGRAAVIPLVETADAAGRLAEIVQLPGINEIYIGLNDLHIEMGRAFMFELLADGTVDSLARTIRDAGIPFGFGGIARMGEGRLPGELVLGEHLRLGSSSVILSRTFHRHSVGLGDLLDNMDFEAEVRKLRDKETELARRSREQQENDRLSVARIVTEIVREKGGNPGGQAAV
jgi:2-keto-3-deoxy-L-rhamnonate aldolase RhmA